MRLSRAVLILACVAASSFAARAEPSATQTPDADSEKAYGTTTYSISLIHAHDFVPTVSANGILHEHTVGYFYRDTNQIYTPTWQAPVNLPDGARLCWLGLYAYDNDNSNAITVQLREHVGWDSSAVSNNLEDVASNDGGYGYTQAAVGGLNGLSPICRTINNNVRRNGGAFNRLVMTIPTTGTNLQVKGVDLWWKRQISAAPGTASFNDVPTNHWAFQHIEALKSSGVTTGCIANVSFCPDNNLTRAEMAVFLARALGLHYGFSWF